VSAPTFEEKYVAWAESHRDTETLPLSVAKVEEWYDATHPVEVTAMRAWYDATEGMSDDEGSLPWCRVTPAIMRASEALAKFRNAEAARLRGEGGDDGWVLIAANRCAGHCDDVRPPSPAYGVSRKLLGEAFATIIRAARAEAKS